VGVDFARTLPIKSRLVNSFREPPRRWAGRRKTIIYVQRHADRGLGASKSRYGYSFCASWKLPSDKFPRRRARPSFEYAADAFARTAASSTLPRDATAPEEFLIKDSNFIPYSKKSLYAYCTKTALSECENLRQKFSEIARFVFVKMSIIAITKWKSIFIYIYIYI